MKAYLGSQEIKDKYVSRMKAHIEADELIRGTGYENGRGCAIGCTLNEYNHSKFEHEIGPEWLAHLVDGLFENVTEGTQQKFALDVLESINPGADLDTIKSPFLVFVLESTLDKFDHVKFQDVLKCVTDVIVLYRSGETDFGKFKEASEAASEAAGVAWAAEEEEAAAWAAARAAEAAARAAWAAWAAWAAEEEEEEEAAARAAAWAAAWAAEEEGAAAWAAARSAEAAARAAEAAEAAARAAAWEEEAAPDSFADKLLELIKDCK